MKADASDLLSTCFRCYNWSLGHRSSRSPHRHRHFVLPRLPPENGEQIAFQIDTDYKHLLASGCLLTVFLGAQHLVQRAVAGAKGRRRVLSGSGQADAEVVLEDRRWARGGRRGAGGGLLATLPSADSALRPFRAVGDSARGAGGLSFFSGLMGRLLSNLRATSRRDADDYDDGWDGASTGRSTGPRFMASTVSGKLAWAPTQSEAGVPSDSWLGAWFGAWQSTVVT